MKEIKEWALCALMKSTHIIHHMYINNTCISVCSRIWASSIHASTSSGYCSVTFFRCPWKTAENNYASLQMNKLFIKTINKIKRKSEGINLNTRKIYHTAKENILNVFTIWSWKTCISFLPSLLYFSVERNTWLKS